MEKHCHTVFHTGFIILLILFWMPGTGHSSKLVNITVQLQWKHQFEFAGYYAAIQQGFYTDRGLHVTLREYENGMNIVDEVLSNRAQYATSNSSIVSARLSGKPVILLANYFKRMPMVLIASPSIKTIGDLRGKTIMASHTDLDSPLLKLAFESENLEIGKDVKTTPHTFNAVPFIEGRVDAMTAFITNEPFYLQQQGIDFHIIEFADYMRSLGDLYLFGSETYVARHARQTQDFIEATNEGWRYALEHKEEIVDLILSTYSQRKTREALLYEAEITHDMILPLPLPIGSVYKTLIHEVGELIMKQEKISDTGQLDGFIFKYQQQKSASLFTAEEQEWLNKHPVITLGITDQFQPTLMRDNNGRLSGLAIDYLEILNSRLGINLKLHVESDFSKVTQKAIKKEIDGLFYSSPNPTWDKYFLYSTPFFQSFFFIYSTIDNPIKKPDLQSLAGKKVGCLKGVKKVQYLLKDIEGIEIVELVDYPTMAEALTSGKVDYLVHSAYLEWWRQKNMQLNFKIGSIITASKYNVVISTRKDWPLLNSILNKGLATITPQEQNKIRERWFGSLGMEAYKNSDLPTLNEEERNYLANITFRRAQATGCIPFDFQDPETGDTIGIAEDYWALIVKKLGVQETVLTPQPLETILAGMKQGTIDIYPSVTITKDKQAYAFFSNSYYEYPIAIAARKKTGFIFGGAVLEGKTVAIGKNCSGAHLLKPQYPAIKFLLVKDKAMALQQVIAGKAYAAVDILPSMQYQLNQLASEGLRLAGVTDIMLSLHVMVAKKHARLIPLLNRAIASITPQEHATIQQKWMTREVITTTDYTLLWQVLAVAFLVLCIFAFWNLRMAREINRRKRVEKQLGRSEDLFNKIVENAPFLIGGMDKEGKFLFWNNACEQLLGYSLEEIKTTASPMELFYKDPNELARKKQNLREKDGCFSEWHPVNKAGKQLDVFWAVIEGPDGGSINLGYDFTEHKQIQSDLLESQEQAKAANRAKSRFLANMSHEIRTPMNAIIGMTELVLDTNLDEKQRNFLNKVNISAAALLDIINDILDFSKIEAEKMEVEKINFSLDTVLTHFNTLIRLKAEEKGLQININRGQDIPEFLKGDPLRIGQILTNLGNNAVKFTEHGGVTVSVSKEETERGSLLHFCVSDTGIGLSPDDINHLFTSFSQADSSVSRKFGGSGLGLAISKGLVEIMGGRIWVESEKGKGSQFHFIIPLELGNAETLKPKTISLKETADLSLKGCTVLLVEDNAFNQELACEILGNKGMVVTTALNGQEAVDRVATESFDVILMDIQMPVMDGYEATIEIRKNHPFNTLPIIALTANIMDDDREKALKAGMNDIIGKPLDVPEMLSTIIRWRPDEMTQD